MPPQTPQDPQNTPSGPALPSPVLPVTEPHPAPAPDPDPSYSTSGVAPLQPTNVNQAYPPGDSPKDPENRYAFFMESKPDAKKSLIPKKSNKFAWVIIGGILSLVILGAAAVILNTSRSSKNNGDTATLTNVVNQQQEIIRVSALGTKDIQATDLANFVATASVTTKSTQKDLIEYVNKHGGQIDTELLKAYKADPQTDTALEAALSASVYDVTFRRIMLQLTTEYQQKLETLSKTSTLETERAIILKNLDAATLLHQMIADQP